MSFPVTILNLFFKLVCIGPFQFLTDDGKFKFKVTLYSLLMELEMDTVQFVSYC